jgi:hypothetical protein
MPGGRAELSGGLQNCEARYDYAVRQMSRAFYVVLIGGLHGQSNLGLENLHKLFYTVLLGTQLLESPKDLPQLRGCLVVSESVDVFMNVLSHRGFSTIQSLPKAFRQFIARSW